MRNLAARTAMGVAAMAAAMSLAWTFLVPAGQTWPSLALAALAGVAAVWGIASSVRPTLQMSDVIRGVDADLPRVPAAVKARVASPRAAS
jgi:hypothetical protein